MNSSNYRLLYGIAPNINDLSVEVFMQEYFRKPVELFTDRKYVRTIRAEQQSKADRNTIEITPNRNYIGVLIKRSGIPETSEIANMVQKAFDNQMIKSHTDEIMFISEYCRNTGISAYTFPPEYAEIDAKLSTMRIVKPRAYVIVNPNIIVDVAIGLDNINTMVNKYANPNKVDTEKLENKPDISQKHAEDDKVQQRHEVKNLKDLINMFDRKNR